MAATLSWRLLGAASAVDPLAGAPAPAMAHAVVTSIDGTVPFAAGVGQEIDTIASSSGVNPVPDAARPSTAGGGNDELTGGGGFGAPAGGAHLPAAGVICRAGADGGTTAARGPVE